MEKRKWTKEEIREYRKEHGAFFYNNKEDSNFLVPKPYGIGWTVNWANPLSWFFVSVLTGFLIVRAFSKMRLMYEKTKLNGDELK
ncbi:MAG: hypothetical protein JJE18_05100 [Eubacteriaceae bacterium]|nr:hypothetical protein [Eubacteriaceae bacterium]